MKDKIFLLAASFLLSIGRGEAAPQSYSYNRPPAGDDPALLAKQFKTELSNLKNDVRNHESEIRTFEEKLHNQEISFEHLQQQFSTDTQSQQDFVRASNHNLESRLETVEQSVTNLETLFRGLTADLKQIKTQANDSVAVLGQYKQKIVDLEKILEAQGVHMQNLEAALHSMIEILQTKDNVKDLNSKIVEGPRTYKVQAGDNLEKIARSQKVSLQSLRDLNQLTNDRIIIGQTLKLPQ